MNPLEFFIEKNNAESLKTQAECYRAADERRILLRKVDDARRSFSRIVEGLIRFERAEGRLLNAVRGEAERTLQCLRRQRQDLGALTEQSRDLQRKHDGLLLKVKMLTRRGQCAETLLAKRKQGEQQAAAEKLTVECAELWSVRRRSREHMPWIDQNMMMSRTTAPPQPAAEPRTDAAQALGEERENWPIAEQGVNDDQEHVAGLLASDVAMLLPSAPADPMGASMRQRSNGEREADRAPRPDKSSEQDSTANNRDDKQRNASSETWACLYEMRTLAVDLYARDGSKVSVDVSQAGNETTRVHISGGSGEVSRELIQAQPELLQDMEHRGLRIEELRIS